MTMTQGIQGVSAWRMRVAGTMFTAVVCCAAALNAQAAALQAASAPKPVVRFEPRATALKLNAQQRGPLAARFSVTITSAAGKVAAAAAPAEWYFFRDDQLIALLKGNIDELWRRDVPASSGNVSFERVFHDDRKVVDYTAGELATLGVLVNWDALACFIDPRELAALRVVSRVGQGSFERLQLTGNLAGQRLSVDWSPDLQLPTRILRQSKAGGLVLIELQEHAADPPEPWPVPGAKSADYQRIDAADFGDINDEPVVKKSQALDVRSGWRRPHQHE
jgi:hypothetical protein